MPASRAAQPGPVPEPDTEPPQHEALAERFLAVRARTRALAAPLSAEDAMLQSMPDASPAKWHLAHTSWFFEQFLLIDGHGQDPHDRAWLELFNSYYQSVGPMHARPRRGMLSRPTLAQVLEYRDAVETRVVQLFDRDALTAEQRQLVELGLHHEQQHQELLLTDVKHGFWCNPLRPAYRDDLPVPETGEATPLRWIDGVEGVVEIGVPPWPAHGAFAYDHESPRHRVMLAAHAIADRPVTNAEYRAFVDDGGYRNPALWMSAGWERVQQDGWKRPLYWDEDLAREFTLGGRREIAAHAPVSHLSWFEADAFARWAGARLPTEAEWEHAAAAHPVRGNFAGDHAPLHPQAAPADASGPRQLYGDVWEWTASAYAPYPGFRTLPGSLGEYNGKFMSGQTVLRGGSCATPAGHVRASYRNFFNAPDRWQFSGLRLARDRP
jgi:ergothioneine biosynthesis protein EgtB